MSAVDGLLLLLWLGLVGAAALLKLRLDALAAQLALLLTPVMPPASVQSQERIIARLREIEALLRTFVQKLDGMERDVAEALRDGPDGGEKL